MSAYLDASAVTATLIEGSATAAVETYLSEGREDLSVSDFAAAEVASALSRLARMGRITVADAAARLGDFEIWRAATSSAVELHAADVRLAYAYVRRFDLIVRTPDAIHLAISRRLDATRVTLDRRLANAARHLDVAVVVPDADSVIDPR